MLCTHCLTQSSKQAGIIIPVLQERKPILREVRSVVPGWQSHCRPLAFLPSSGCHRSDLSLHAGDTKVVVAVVKASIHQAFFTESENLAPNKRSWRGQNKNHENNARGSILNNQKVLVFFFLVLMFLYSEWNIRDWCLISNAWTSHLIDIYFHHCGHQIWKKNTAYYNYRLI